MIRIIHISDLHITQNADANRGVDSLLTSVYQKHFSDTSGVTRLLLTGDIIDNGREDELRQAEQLLGRFKGKIIVTPGNHDYGIAGTFSSTKDARRRFEELCNALGAPSGFIDRTPVQTELSFESSKLLLIGINSTNENTSPGGYATGWIEKNQLNMLESILETENLQPKLVYLHHRPEPCGGVDGRLGRELLDRKAFLKKVLNRVSVVAFGHDGGDASSDATIGSGLKLVQSTIFSNANHSVGMGGWHVLEIEGTALRAYGAHYPSLRIVRE